ncbi:hypothetical protein [Pantoea cypripedii]|uniref:hypothetical protein n=1 Tax=Pantoea cypripedii TaxID=55209 RepID=UPI00111BF63D|nr:hypothetical protein [Pantoea cypripedii]MBP2197271.1 hypothetical protein [Pantoea cypripedii]
MQSKLIIIIIAVCDYADSGAECKKIPGISLQIPDVREDLRGDSQQGAHHCTINRAATVVCDS